MKRSLPALSLALAIFSLAIASLGLNAAASAQALPAASRLADLQVGGGFSFAKSDYVPEQVRGYSFYGDFDLRGHYGLEADFHQLNDPHPDPLVPSRHFYERTYEIGGRYVRRYHRFAPYAKLLGGRGVIELPAQEYYDPTSGNLITAIANPAYNLMTLGLGVDYPLSSRVNLRADFEYQRWFASDNFISNGLTPKVFTFGAAYHFPAGRPTRITR